MSGKQSGIVWELDLTESKGVSKESKKSVLLAMADHADHNGNNVFPSVGLVAWMTDLSPRQVTRIISALKKDGLVKLISDAHPRYRTRVYRLCFENAKRKQRYAPDTMSPTTQEASTPDMQSSTHDTQVSPYPSLEPSVQPSLHGNNELFPIADALSEVSGCDFDANRQRLFKEARELARSNHYKRDEIPEIIREKFGPGGWYYSYDWRGKKGQRPHYTLVRELWRQWEGEPVKPTGGREGVVSQLRRVFSSSSEER